MAATDKGVFFMVALQSNDVLNEKIGCKNEQRSSSNGWRTNKIIKTLCNEIFTIFIISSWTQILLF